MSEKLYFVGLTSISKFLNSHEKDQPLYFSIGRQEIGGVHGITREKWTVCFSDVINGVCRYYLQTIGYTDKINGEPFNREIIDNCRSRAENLREQIKSLKSKHNLVQGGVSFPKDLILLEGSAHRIRQGKQLFSFDKLNLPQCAATRQLRWTGLLRAALIKLNLCEIPQPVNKVGRDCSSAYLDETCVRLL